MASICAHQICLVLKYINRILLFVIYVKVLELNCSLDPVFFFLSFIDSVAHFLESRGMIEDALEVATDPDYRFELAIQLGRLEVAKVSPMQWCH